MDCLFKLSLFHIIILCFVFCVFCDQPSVKTKLGTVRGNRKTVTFRDIRKEVDEYLGIPFAKPPVGELRFKKPLPAEPFTEPLDATEFKSSCPQHSLDVSVLTVRSTNEDCLYLNVYVPVAGASDKPAGRAVMVWIYGGGFAFGSASVYEASTLASYGDVIVVTINYRVGLYGFLNIGDERAAGNMGLFDQHQALKWVNENIGAFGGDNSRVTIFGESAGGTSVSMQSVYPPNRGLFQNAICESGTITMPFVISQKDTVESAKFVAEQLGCNTDTIDTVFSCLQNADVERVINLFEEVSKDIQNTVKISFTTTADGEFVDINYREPESERLKFFQELNVISGTNGQEGLMWSMGLGGSQEQEAIDNITVTSDAMKTSFIPMMFGMNYYGKELTDPVRDLIALEYTDWENYGGNMRDAYVKLTGDLFFNVPSTELGQLHANGSNSNTWMYSFRYRLDLPLLPYPSWGKYANHGDEVAAVFGYAIDVELIHPDKKGYRPPESELDLSEIMMTAWTNFAKTG